MTCTNQQVSSRKGRSHFYRADCSGRPTAIHPEMCYENKIPISKSDMLLVTDDTNLAKVPRVIRHTYRGPNGRAPGKSGPPR